MKHMHTKTYGERDDTPLEHAVDEHWDEGKDLLKHLPKKEGHGDTFFPELKSPHPITFERGKNAYGLILHAKV